MANKLIDKATSEKVKVYWNGCCFNVGVFDFIKNLLSYSELEEIMNKLSEIPTGKIVGEDYCPEDLESFLSGASQSKLEEVYGDISISTLIELIVQEGKLGSCKR